MGGGTCRLSRIGRMRLGTEATPHRAYAGSSCLQGICGGVQVALLMWHIKMGCNKYPKASHRPFHVQAT